MNHAAPAGEMPLRFDCHGDALVGVLHRPERLRRRGIVIVVGGGPQYRAGGHRQLTLWSRALAALGYPVLRFDYRGMGDSHGEFRGFTEIDDDIRAAVDQLIVQVPTLEEIVLWGECDASSAILFYACRDPRVKGIVLLNPWVRTEAGQAKAILRFYYLQRIMQPSFWRKLLGGKLNPFKALRAALDVWRTANTQTAGARGMVPNEAVSLHSPIPHELPLPERMRLGAQRFGGQILLVLSGRDLIAKEFLQLIQGSPDWQRTLRDKPLTRHDLPEGDHTFSSAVQREQVLQWAVHWLEGW
jgi:exosortase A-associated hydrolase 1